MKKHDFQFQISNFESRMMLRFILLLALTGCLHKESPAPKGYFGPTKTLEQVVAQINSNNQKIPTLWARFSYQAWIRDPETKKETYLIEEKNGTLQYRAPAEFRLLAKKEFAGVILDLGINREKYWMIAPEPGPDTMWWGTVSAGNQAISKSIPLPPQGMLEVLGVSTLNTNLLAQPAPVVRFDNDARVYMLVWVKQYGERYIAVREAWYDMNTLLPVKVRIFDPDGRILLDADLSQHRAVEKSKTAPAPRVATEYHLCFPENGSRMTMNLTTVELEHNGAPDDNSFRFVKTIPVRKEIRIDEEK